MFKRDIQYDLAHYPCYVFDNGRLFRITRPQNWHRLHLHHFITTQWQQKNPEKFIEVEHLQKLIFLPPQMHMELHAKHSRFKEKYGIEIKELLFDWRDYMISAKQAKAKSDANSLKLLEEDIDKLINRAVDKGLKCAFKTGQIPDEIQEKVIAAGYDIELGPTGMKIMWG